VLLVTVKVRGILVVSVTCTSKGEGYFGGQSDLQKNTEEKIQNNNYNDKKTKAIINRIKAVFFDKRVKKIPIILFTSTRFSAVLCV
jgi:hypothetical protein